MLKKFRPLLSLGLLVIALTVAVFYLNKHRYLLTQLGHIPLTTGLAVLALYGVFFLTLMLKFKATLSICNIKLSQNENAKLNANTLLINFFLPGQGGPVYTGYYLLKKHKLKIKNYIMATILYYIIYAILAVYLLLGRVRPWWQTSLSIILVGGIGLTVTRKYMARQHISRQSLNLHPRTLIQLTLATVAQVIVQTLIFGVELHSINHHIALSQILTYTGAANLTLFVALTPGAIGIRESFLIFTQHLNHLSSGVIVLAGLIDRSVYLVFLGLLILITFGLHVNVWSVKHQESSLKIKAKLSVTNEKP